jgi:hypothetical protein
MIGVDNCKEKGREGDVGWDPKRAREREKSEREQESTSKAGKEMRSSVERGI